MAFGHSGLLRFRRLRPAVRAQARRAEEVADGGRGPPLRGFLGVSGFRHLFFELF